MWDLALFRMQSCNFSANFLDKFRFLDVAERSVCWRWKSFASELSFHCQSEVNTRLWDLHLLNIVILVIDDSFLFASFLAFFFSFFLVLYKQEDICTGNLFSEHCCFLPLLCLRKHLIFDFISMLLGQNGLVIRFIYYLFFFWYDIDKLLDFVFKVNFMNELFCYL